MRFFNTAGPVNPVDHYCLPPLQRFDLEEIVSLIGQKKYFLLHAPRQTGKTSSLLALMDYLNEQGDYRCAYINAEIAQAAREDVAAAMQAILSELADKAEIVLNDTFVADHWSEILARDGPFNAFGKTLSLWCSRYAQPLVLLIDEIDALIGDTLIALLRQLRTGYAWRPHRFPQTVILCGVRDLRDYRIHSRREKAIITGGSAFNIKAESLRLGDFTRPEIDVLYQQHTQETGQAFSTPVLDRIWELTQGQPWLVNALGYETCFRMKSGRDRGHSITLENVEQARENLILHRETHLDQLADKLQEERVRRVIAPLLSGSGESENVPVDDIDYVHDLGLIKTEGQIRIANPIYAEIIPRQLSYSAQLNLAQEPAWYIRADSGRLDFDRLLTAFQAFFREHSEHWIERFQYKEAGPQLLIQAFLQRVINGGGRIEREYGLGRMRTDLLVIWPYGEQIQSVVIELKLLHKSLEQTLAAGLEQTWQYMDRCAAEEGHLVIFDRGTQPWDEKLFTRAETYRDRQIRVWGM